MYAEPSKTFEELIVPCPAEVGEVATWLRTLFLAEFPQLEGNGKHMRHVKLDAIPDTERDELVALARVPVARRG